MKHGTFRPIRHPRRPLSPLSGLERELGDRARCRPADVDSETVERFVQALSGLQGDIQAAAKTVAALNDRAYELMETGRQLLTSGEGNHAG